MNKCLNFLILLGGFHVEAQKIEKFLDLNGKEIEPQNACFYKLTEKTDSGWLERTYFTFSGTICTKKLFKDQNETLENGMELFFFPNKKIAHIGKYINGKKEGPFLFYYPDGKLKDSANYKNGKVLGNSLSWYNNGYLMDSIKYEENEIKSFASWFDNGVVSETGLKDNEDKKIGAWKYYRKNGKLSDFEYFEKGRLLNRKYFDEEGKPVLNNTIQDSDIYFPKKKGNFYKYFTEEFSSQRNSFPIENSTYMEFNLSVDENGYLRLENSYLPMSRENEYLVEKVIKNSPLWKPKFSHNRAVQKFFRFAIWFKRGPISYH